MRFINHNLLSATILLLCIQLVHSEIYLTPKVPANCASLSQCSSHGACLNINNKATCLCSTGYTGTTCSQAVTCNSKNKCSGNGACTAFGTTSETCICSLLWSGTNCTQLSTTAKICDDNYCVQPTCAKDRCSSHGACFFTSSTGTIGCICSAGYYGPNCQYAGSDPQLNNCNGKGALFTNQYGQQTCLCSDGYTGTSCQTTITSNRKRDVGFVSVPAAVQGGKRAIQTSRQSEYYNFPFIRDSCHHRSRVLDFSISSPLSSTSSSSSSSSSTVGDSDVTIETSDYMESSTSTINQPVRTADGVSSANTLFNYIAFTLSCFSLLLMLIQ